MYEDVPISNMPNKVRVIKYQNENVIRFHLENTLNIYTKKIRTPGTKVSGVFFITKDY